MIALYIFAGIGVLTVLAFLVVLWIGFTVAEADVE